MAEHQFDPCAGFRPLPRAAESRTRVFIGREAAAGAVSVQPHHRVVVALGRAQVAGVVGLLEILGGFAEALAEIHAVPGGDATRPVGGALVVDARRIQQPALSGLRIEPVDVVEVVPAAVFLPACRQQVFERLRLEPAVVAQQEFRHAPVAGGLVMRAEHVNHHHVRPKIQRLQPPQRVLADEVGGGSEPAVLALRAEHGLHPLAAFLEDAPVAQHMAEVDVAF